VTRMFERILIANRGEIACRVARTARRLGIEAVAVYSDADANALHVEACDQAFRIGAAPPRESYLNGGAIIDVAKRSGAQAIHPGYGFLSEQPALAERCAAAGIVFVGPGIETLGSLGNKLAARQRAEAAGVPVVPGTFEPLRHVPDDRVVVLGLVSTKRSEVEPAAVLERRVAEASQFVPLERLGLSQPARRFAHRGERFGQQIVECRLQLRDVRLLGAAQLLAEVGALLGIGAVVLRLLEALDFGVQRTGPLG